MHRLEGYWLANGVTLLLVQGPGPARCIGIYRAWQCAILAKDSGRQ
jgi:hypothetical protein